MNRSVTIALALILALPLAAQTASDELKGVQDNSFLVEEAYNQDPGVVQHLATFQRANDSGEWELVFTQEWPAGSVKHQLSYDIPLVHDTGTRIDDLTINYRYQLLGDADADLAIAPRLTVILPTSGDHTGVTIGVPISRVLTPRLISHTDVDATLISGGNEIDLGQSVIYALSGRVHAMLEAAYSRPDEGESSFVISPGLRWAFNRPRGLQIVQGIGVPIGIGPSAGEDAILLYLSFEHPFRRR